MSDLYWLTDEQMARLQPYFRKSRGRPRVDDRRVLSGIVFVNRNGLRWSDAPREYGPHKTLYNRWKRWGERGVFLRMMEGLAAASATPKTIMIDATYALRNMVERCFNKLKNARRLATRYDKTADSYLGFIHIVSIRLWMNQFANAS